MRPYLICPLRDLGDRIAARWFSRAWPGLAVEWIAEPDSDADSFFAHRGRVCDRWNSRSQPSAGAHDLTDADHPVAGVVGSGCEDMWAAIACLSPGRESE